MRRTHRINGAEWVQKKPPCYRTHKGLVIPTKQGDRTVYGGNCFTPHIVDANIYVSLATNRKGTQIVSDTEQLWRYPVTNGKVPSNVKEFRKFLTQLRKAIVDENQKVHIGCIGGHGRTGLVLTALYSVCAEGGEENAISVVRNNYCHKAVETTEQVEWLSKYFNVIPVIPSYGKKTKF